MVRSRAVTPILVGCLVLFAFTRALQGYELVVNSGGGDGSYAAGEVVGIAADPAPTGGFFDAWVGDAGVVADVNGPTTTVTMPDGDVEITARYAEVADGLISRFTFDEDGRDSIGTNHGTLANGALVVYDPWRGSNVLSLDGSDDYVALPAEQMAAGRPEVTLTMWVRPDDWSGTRTLYDECGGPGGEYWQFSVLAGAWYTRDNSTGSTGSRNNDLAMPSVPTGQWHHLALVYSASADVKAIYYDGALHGSTDVSVDTLTSDRSVVGIGFACDGQHFDGLMDDVRLYDRALGPTEIAALAAETLYALTVNSGSGGGSYPHGAEVAIAADVAPSGYAFERWGGDTGSVANPLAAGTTVLMPAGNVEVTAIYEVAVPHTLTVNNGTGGGSYTRDMVVPISADAPASGEVFREWIGDTEGVGNVNSPNTTYVMPDEDATITATYIVAPSYTLTVNSGIGGGSYGEGTVVVLVADASPSGHLFNMWVGDLEGFADLPARLATTTDYTMPAANVEVTATYRPASSPLDWWPYFNIFCMKEFGAENEPLTYEIPGADLAFDPEGEWSYVSKNSACLAFETNLPAKTYVEYGLTSSYGSQVDVETDRYHYLHICHLTGLASDTTYHYRFVAEDERGNVIASLDDTFTTATPPNVVYIPGGVTGPPYNLSLTNRTYLVTQDLVCNRTAFNINVSDVTLDLGGHTVIYNQEDHQVVEDFRDTSAMGVRAISRSNVRVVNGIIKQGLGYNTAGAGSLGYSPIYAGSCSGEIAGIRAEYAGSQITGMDLDSAGGLVAHHNVLLDRGGEIDDRHLAPRGIDAGGTTHHNLILRHRQMAIDGANNSDFYHNEVYVDSCATNAAGIMFYKDVNSSAYGNRIFGTGYLVLGISTVSSGISDIMVHDNFIHLQATEPDTRWSEYGAQSGAYCCRVTWGGDNIQYYDNVMVTYGRDGGMVRGTWFNATPSIVDVVYRDNILKAVLENMDSDIQGCVVHTGDSNPGDAPIFYEHNRLISNFCNARMGEDYYGAGCNAEFYDNTFVKEGPDRPDYRTIGVGYGSFRSTGHKFFDSAFEGGAGYDQVRFDGTGLRDFYVGWTLTVKTLPGVNVTVKDAFDTVVFTGVSDGDGKAQTLLYQYMQDHAGRTYYTDHTVMIEKDGETAETTVTMDAKKTVEIYFHPVTIEAWHSAVEHGHGVGEALLEIPDDGSFTEPRATGISKLLVTFNRAIDPNSLVPGNVLIGGLDFDNNPVDLNAIVIGTATRSGDEVAEITFAPALPDFAKYCVRLLGIRGVDGTPLTGDRDRIMTALVGDASGDMRVNATDLSRVRAARANPIDPGEPLQVRADISCDGRVNATDLSRVRARRPNDARAIDEPEVEGTVFQESNGLVAFEAENFHGSVPNSGHEWVFVTEPEGFLGSGAMQALPNLNDLSGYIDSGYAGTSPRLDYNVNFTTAGIYYVWVRGFAGSSQDDSCHVGLDGQEISTCDRIGNFAYDQWDHWDWTNYTMGGPAAYLTVPDAGEHTINLWMREDGLIVDRLLLTTDPGYVPPGD